MSMTLVTANLDAESLMIWRAIPHKSAWLREQLTNRAIERGELAHLQGDVARANGAWDGRCNPNALRGVCVGCWSAEDIQALEVTTASGRPMFIPPSLDRGDPDTQTIL